jgi:hypothetical protein
MKNFEIGEVYEIEGIKVKCVKAKDDEDACGQCAFQWYESEECEKYCLPVSNKNVYFKEIEV